MNRFVVGLCYGCMIVVIILMAKGLIESADHAEDVRQEQATLEAVGLGDALIFPEGWKPVECESDSTRDSNIYDCTWVCQPADGRLVYRYCQPTIQSVDPQ